MSSARLWPLAAFAIPALILPVVPGVPPFWIVLLTYVWLYALVAIGLVVLTGVGGLTSLGQAMFVGVSAYTTAILTTRYGLSPWLTLPLSVGLTGLLAFFIGLITLRLSGHYLAVATIAWNISFFYLAANLDIFGRYDGISGIPPITIGSLSFVDPGRFYHLALAAVVLAAIATQNLLRSRVGRSIRSLKGSIVAAETLGIDPARAKRTAFVYAAILAAVSGWLYAHMQRSVNPTPFDIEASIEYLLMTVVGGGAQVWGAIAGGAIIPILRALLQNI
jgi:branched-chain amino acid transport system permease protein